MAQRAVNLAAVAARAGVSTMTASRALRGSPQVREPVREAVLAAAKLLGYRPSLLPQALARGSLPLIAIETIDLDNPFFGGLARRIVRSVRAEGYRCALCDGIDDLADFARELPLRGAILLAGNGDHQARMGRVPCIALGARVGTRLPPVDICTDLHPAYGELTRRLIAEGRRQVAILCPRDYYDQRIKFSTVRRVLRQQGLTEVDLPERVVEHPHACAQLLVAQPGTVDALFCRNDQIAAETVHALQRAGIRCPEQVRVVGCDGTVPLAGVWTVPANLDELAGLAVRLLLERIDGAPATPPHVVTPAPSFLD